MKRIILLVCSLFFTSTIFSADVDVSKLPNTPKTFSKAKKLLYGKVYKGHRETLYCGCSYTKHRKVNLNSCGVKPRKNAKRAKRIEAEHVFPASQFGNYRQCWREKICTKKNGKKYKGRKCCEHSDPVFKAAHNDLHNLFPSVGEVNGDRSNYKWGSVQGEIRSYGKCNFEIDRQRKIAEPPESSQGEIARTMLYMEKTYGFRLAKSKKKMYKAWSKADAPNAWEIERNKRIKAIQGNGNTFIENYR